MLETTAGSPSVEPRIVHIQGMFTEDLSACFVRDGLLNTPVALLPQGFGYFTPSLYYCIAPFSRFHCQSLWCPSFLPAGPWFRAVSRFQFGAPLTDCLRHWLVSESPDLDVLFNYVYQDRPLTESFVSRDILDMPIRITKRYLFYFDNISRRYQQCNRASALSARRIPVWHEVHHSLVDGQCWVMACRRFRTGMTLEACLDLFLKTTRSPQPDG